MLSGVRSTSTLREWAAPAFAWPAMRTRQRSRPCCGSWRGRWCGQVRSTRALGGQSPPAVLARRYTTVDDPRMPIDCPKCSYARQTSDTAPETECPRCGVIFAKYLDAIARNPELKRPWPKPSQVVTVKPVPRAAAPDPFTQAQADYAAFEADRIRAETLICKKCGTLNPTGALPGNGWIEFLLWAVFLWPIALIYSIWRRSARNRVCSACASRELVGVQTPIGQSLVADYFPDGSPEVR